MAFVTSVASIAIGAAALALFGASRNPLRPDLFLSNRISQTEGLRVVFEDECPEIDLVCVHGLGGDPIETWTLRKHGTAVNWTRDFLPNDIRELYGVGKQVRVLTYGYSSKLFSGSQSGFFARSAKGTPLDARVLKYLPQALYLHANRLIEQLAAERADNAKERPVIFIAHSLGGLIVKSALVQASMAMDERDAPLKALQLLTIGVLFFGTPQREVDWKRWSNLLGKMVNVAMLTPIGPVMQPLADQAEQFNLQIERYKSVETNFTNFSFYEQKMSQIGTSPEPALVVDVDVAIPIHNDVAIPTLKKNQKHIWQKIPLQRSHKELAKFDDGDSGYIQVLSCIKSCLDPENIQDARNRHHKFFKHMNSPSASIEDEEEASNKTLLTESQEILRITRVSSCDSKKKIAEIQGENRKSLAKSESDNGLSDSMTLSMVEVIASNFAELRDYEKADALYKRLFVAVQEAYLPCSKESADVLEQMARVAVHQGRLVEATKILHRVRDIQSSLKKPSSPETLETSERIAGLYERQGLYDDAIGEYKEIIKYRMDTPGSRAEETLRVMECRANAYRVKGKRDKNALETAAARYREVVQIRIQNLRQCKQRTEEQQEGPTEQQCQSYLRETMKKLAEVYRALGNSREERILREELVLLEAREKSKPPPDTSKPIK